MRNCLVMGSGRSGTSLVAGLLDRAGYNTGDNYLAVRRANPHGFFEDSTVNGLNDDLLAPHRPAVRRWVLRRGLVPWWKRFRVPGWLLERPVDGSLAVSDETRQTIDGLVGRQPFAYKDPRFAHTLPAWRQHLPGRTRFVCVFRHPAVTADSILREVDEAPFLQNFDVDPVDVWEATYRTILSRSGRGWMFVHFDQLVDGDGVDRLASFLDAPVDRSLVDPSASRSKNGGRVPEPVDGPYRRLCDLAGYA